MDLELKAESSGATLFGKSVSELQTNVSVSGKNITGTLNYVTGYTGFSSNPEEQEGHFLALDLSDNDFTGLTSVMVGLDPSAGSGLVEIINDPDKNGVFRIRLSGSLLLNSRIVRNWMPVSHRMNTKRFPGQGPEVLMPGLSLQKDDFGEKEEIWGIGMCRPKK